LQRSEWLIGVVAAMSEAPRLERRFVCDLHAVSLLAASRGSTGMAQIPVGDQAWRYRSEVAPATTAGAILAAGWWLRAAHRDWWPWLLIVSDLAAFALLMCDTRIGLPRFAGRIYAAVAVIAAGGWLAVSALPGPLTSPLPQVPGVGAVIFAVPWWAHRRRRARACPRRAPGCVGCGAHGHLGHHKAARGGGNHGGEPPGRNRRERPTDHGGAEHAAAHATAPAISHASRGR
jgi:hypothetical protein